MATPTLERTAANRSKTAELLLNDLSLDNNDDALRVLEFLLSSNAVTESQVRQAHHHIKTSASGATEELAPVMQSNKKQKKKKKVKKHIDPSTIRQRHVALLLYYDGRKYSGLAENRGVPSDTSVERALFTALQTAHLVSDSADNRKGYSRSGRTDKGVSAVGQVVALPLRSAFPPTCSAIGPNGPPFLTDLPSRSGITRRVWMPPKKDGQEWVCKDVQELAYDTILNKLLPSDIRILGWTPVSDEFSARFSTSSRTYRYYFMRKWLDEDRMRDGLQRMVGQHDFSNFCKMNIEEVSNFVRIIHTAEVKVVDEDVGYFLIHGQAFLWHQIRCIASILFLIGKKLEEPTIVSELLDVKKHPGKPSYPLADEHHLVLHECIYRNLTFGHSVPNLWRLTIDLRRQWEDHILMAARIQSAIERILDCTVVATDMHAFAVAKLQARAKKRKTETESIPPEPRGATSELTWREALVWLQQTCNFRPDPDATTEFAYTPLLQRSKGPAYQEKVASLLANSSTKRQHRFQENQAKKSKTKQEDDDFYHVKLQQGGSAQS